MSLRVNLCSEVKGETPLWRGEDHEYVKLRGSDGALYIIRYGAAQDEWEVHLMEAPRAPGG